MSEFKTSNAAVVKKLSAIGAPVETVTVKGNPGLWIPAAHVAAVGALSPRLVGSTLVWVEGPLTLRIEAAVSKRQALTLARSFRG